jgi:cytochrome c-type biogenesis protein CcmH
MLLRSSFVLYLLWAILSSPLHAAAPDLEEKSRVLAAELRCVVCQNLSVADSPSEMAQQMRAIVREQLEAGKTPEEIKDFFVSKYGEWVLLRPKTSGFSLLVWLLPYVALTLGVGVAMWLIRRWASGNTAAAGSLAAGETDRLGSEILRADFVPPESDDRSPRAELMRERMRLGAEIGELDFDFQSGKHSEADFRALRCAIENKAAAVIEKLGALPPEAGAKTANEKKPLEKTADRPAEFRRRLRRWQLVGGASFLLLFGLALGVFLTQSLRPRMSEQDSITGDFMTGTTGGATAALLREGKQAFAKQEFAKAIDVFKQVLAQEPNQPEAHAYMGFILVQAGHGDGALMAFEKALAVVPNFPMALWGKGMVLYRDRQDYAGARVVLEKLLQLVPPGEERSEIARVLAEIPVSGSTPEKAAGNAPKSPASGQTISGTITVDPKLKDKIDSRAALFIIARQAGGSTGPPLAVKKIDKPTFPLHYSIGPDNVMMQGTPFAGKLTLTVRLDKDGNAMTREAGNLLGDYKMNPIDTGSRNVDVVLDQLAH